MLEYEIRRAKKFAYFIIILTALCMLLKIIGYVQYYNSETVPGTSVKVYVDQETGFNYLIYDGHMCPRYNADGTLYVEEDQIED